MPQRANAESSQVRSGADIVPNLSGVSLTIYSGGQTGADMAGLRAAAELRMPIAGYCPKGRRNEDGVIPVEYPLRETKASGYPERTRMNVLETDGTVIIHGGKKGRGTQLTINIAGELKKPIFEVDTRRPPSVQAFAEWLDEYGIHRLNIAGPRGSSDPELEEAAKKILTEYFSGVVAKSSKNETPQQAWE